MRGMTITVGISLWLLSFVGMTTPRAVGQTTIRIHDREVVSGPDGHGVIDVGDTRLGTAPPCCAMIPGFDFRAAAFHSEPVPGGGTLSPIAFANPATLNASGAVAFEAGIDGAARNQGIFVADALGLHAIAIGCGQGGGSGMPGSGCGDPSPIGGTFSGFFGGTVFTPALDDAGDVLFIADVNGGSSPRGLFLFQATSSQIVKVAAVGDPSPIGGTIVAVGPGSMNNHGEIVFLAQSSGSGNVDVLKWTNGVVTKHVAFGDASPVGGTFSIIGRESFGFVDGTTIPIGPVPGINDAGQVSFASLVAGGSVERGVFVTTGGVHQLYVAGGEATPVGGVYLDFWGPLLNGNGDVAFECDVNLGGGQYTGGWFVGRPGNWRKALVFFDTAAGGQVVGLAVSRNPMRALDDCGNLELWCNVRRPDMSERETMVVTRADGHVVVVAQQGDAAAGGGSIGTMDAWPVLNDARQGVLGCATPGSPGGHLSTRFVFTSRAADPNVGTVNSLPGPVTDALFLNGGSGTVTIGTGVPLTLSMIASPAGPASGRYFVYAWRTTADNPIELRARGEVLGCTIHPTPLHAGRTPQPIRCVRGGGIPAIVCAGVPGQTGPARAPFSITLPNGIGSPIAFTVQGVLEDQGAGNATGFSTTNVVRLVVQ